MLDFLGSIVDNIILGVDYLVNAIKSIGNLLKLLPLGYNFAAQITMILPEVFVAFIVAGVSISILLLILGRV